MLKNSLPSPTCIVNIRCLAPSTSSQPYSVILTADKSKSAMTTATATRPTHSVDYISANSSASPATCNICTRQLYSFEEILRCRICYGSYHWRCIKPETISHYGENENFICDHCTDSTTMSSPHRTTATGLKIKSPDAFETNYRDFVHVPPKLNSSPAVDTNVVNAIRYFEDKQQQQPSSSQTQIYRTTKTSEFDDHLPSASNGHEYQHRHGSYIDDSQMSRRTPQQYHPNGIEINGDNTSSNMFQANYEYTPLKDYAAARNAGRTTTTTSANHPTTSNGFQNSPPNHANRSAKSRYGGGLQYTNHGFDPAVSRLVEAPSDDTTHFTSPTIDNLSIHNRQHHFVSTTNLNIKENPSRRPQASVNETKASLGQSTPYPSQVRDRDSSPLKSSLQQPNDQYSAVGSDSGIVMVSSQHQAGPDENLTAEKKLTDLVQQLGKQLETDAQKINEKLELKLKSLEEMIHQQTYVIRRQDAVIERLQAKISKIEGERDHFRERLSHHEQEKKTTPTTTTKINQSERFSSHEHLNTPDPRADDKPTVRKHSNASANIPDNNKPPIKKAVAPRIEPQWTHENNDNQPTIAKIITANPLNRERFQSDSSLSPSVTSHLVSSTPLIEKPAATNRLNNIIHQSDTKETSHSSATSYNLAEIRQQDRGQSNESISMRQEEVVTSIHHEETLHREKPIVKQRRTNSSRSSSSSASTSSTKPAQSINITSINITPTNNRNSNLHRSFESLQHSYGREQGLKPSNKAVSLEFGTKPVQYDDAGSIYITPVEASHPAIQSHAVVKGWLRKQNRDSFLKRIERYYCVLTADALLMHKHDYDRTPTKAVNLRGAKVVYYEDPKHGPSLELTWSKPSKNPKHYHLYALNAQEAQQWVDGIQTAIDNLDTNLPLPTYN